MVEAMTCITPDDRTPAHRHLRTNSIGHVSDVTTMGMGLSVVPNSGFRQRAHWPKCQKIVTEGEWLAAQPSTAGAAPGCSAGHEQANPHLLETRRHRFGGDRSRD